MQRRRTSRTISPDLARVRTAENRRHFFLPGMQRKPAARALIVKKRTRPLQEVAHFIKVTHSYGRDLFHCYRIADLPRPKNALKQAFGSLRYHERRARGRKVASPPLLLSGCVRMAVSTATRICTVPLGAFSSTWA